MTHYWLGLGSNLQPKKNLPLALKELNQMFEVQSVAPSFSTPPLLPEKAPDEWYQAFFNTAVVVKTDKGPEQVLSLCQSIEQKLGRSDERARWSPRTMDIDLLGSSEDALSSPQLNLPHLEFWKRSFCLAPMAFLPQCPQLPKQEILQAKRSKNLSALMAIVNITPDSFSESAGLIDYENIYAHLRQLCETLTPFIDLGAESTRPGATPLSDQEEMERLRPILESLPELKRKFPFTKWSLDTYHPKTAQMAVEMGVNVLNDVSGLKTPEMKELCEHFEFVVAMHSLTVPARKDVLMDKKGAIIDDLLRWRDSLLKELSPRISQDKIIIDPGIGFGKSPMQSMELLQGAHRFLQEPSLYLFGHSRKSFYNLWSERPFADRDLETVGSSLLLQQRGVDILRVHNIEDHHRALFSFEATKGYDHEL